MNKSLRQSMLVFLATTLLGAASAEASCNSARCTSTIKRLYLTGSTFYTWLNESEAELKKLDCKAVQKKYIQTFVDHPAFPEWHGMLLAAFLSDHPVTIRVGKTDKGECRVSYIYIDK